MIWGVALYLRGRPLLAGVVLGVGACVKLVAPYALFVLVAARAAAAGRAGAIAGARGLARPAGWRRCVIATAAACSSALLGDPRPDRAAVRPTPTGKLITGGPFAHICAHVQLRRAADEPARPAGDRLLPVGVAGRLQADRLPAASTRAHPGRLYGSTRRSHFLGMISPPILLLALPGWCSRLLGRCAGGAGCRPRGPRWRLVGLAWFIGTWAPFALLSLFDQRTSYLYYMVIVMPGMYVAAPTWSGGIGRAGAVRRLDAERGRGGRGRCIRSPRCPEQRRAVQAAVPDPQREHLGGDLVGRAAGRVDHVDRRRACASRSAGGGRSCGCAASSPRRRRPAAPRSRAPCAR